MSNVPNFPGVPPLSSYGQFTSGLILADAISALSSILLGSWGVYLNGQPALVAGTLPIPGLSLLPGFSLVDSFVAFDFRQDFPLLDYQIEQGQFTTYDKITRPFLIRVRLSKGGTSFDRQNFLNAVGQAANSYNIYDIVTPEQTYLGCTVNHVDYRRNADNGVGLVVVDMWFEQVMQTGIVAFSQTNVAAPGAASPVSTGNVQAVAPSTVEQSFLPSVQ